MIWQIAKKDFLQNIISARFIIGFILCLFLIPFSILINIDDYGDRIGRGVYIYKVKIQTESKETIEKFEKLVILK